MKDIRTEKMITVALIMKKYNYEINETTNRRINGYNFEANTVITHNDAYIKISTETGIKGVSHSLYLFPDGISKLDFEFN